MAKLRSRDSPPRRGREALHHIVAELLGGEVAVLEQRTGLNFDVSDGTKLLDQGTEGVERADRLQPMSI